MLALLFPGQGSQRPGMGSPWRDHPSWEVVAQLSAATGRDVAELITEADADTLKQTRNAQLAAFATSLVILDAARRAVPELRPAAVAGHSLGEYTAIVAAGGLTPGDGAMLVAARGAAMQQAADAQPGTMAAVLGLEPDTLAGICDTVPGAWMANDNAPGQIVVAGTAEGVEAAGAKAKEAGAKRVMPLAVGGAFHSPLMGPAQAPLDEALANAAFADTEIPVIANVDASAHTDSWGKLLSAQLMAPVRWRESLVTLRLLRVTHFLELGPGTELSGMVKRTVDGAARANVATPTDLDTLADFVASSEG